MTQSSNSLPSDGTDRWRSALLLQGATLRDAIRSLTDSGLRIGLLTAPDGTLLGTLTDGDIRRGLLRGLDLTSLVGSVAKTDPFVVPPEVSREMVLRMMQVNLLDAIPVVDAARRVIGLHILSELLSPSPRANTMVIMAGGRGSRLGAHTETCPKPLLQVAGKPMLEHILDAARGDGFRHFVFAIHYLGHMIEDYFGDGSRWGVDIQYIRETSPLGTVGAVRLLTPRPLEPIVVSNGDLLTDIRFSELVEFHVRHTAAATMAVRLHEWEHPFGVVRTKGVDIIGFEEKPITRTHINAGIYVLEPHALDALVMGESCDMPTLFGRLQEQGARTIVYPMHEPWLDVGGLDDFLQAGSASSDSRPGALRK
jgi:dTDP-glucose pyrophosphorylase